MAFYVDDQTLRRQQAKDCLTRALALLTDDPTTEGLAAALLWTGTAVVHMAALDPGEKARALAESVIRKARDLRTEELRGDQSRDQGEAHGGDDQ